MCFTVLLCVEMLQVTTVQQSLYPRLSYRSVMTLGWLAVSVQCVAETGEMWRKLGSQTGAQIGTLAGPGRWGHSHLISYNFCVPQHN